MNTKQYTTDEVQRIAEGTAGFLDDLARVWPSADHDELVGRVREFSQSPTACDLLARLLSEGRQRQARQG